MVTRMSYGDPHGPKHVLYVREQASTPVGFTGNMHSYDPSWVVRIEHGGA